MGYVSLIEDAIKRFESDLHFLTKEIPNPNLVSVEERSSVVNLLQRGDKVLYEINKCLEIATDPSIDLAHSLKKAEARIIELNQSNIEFRKTCDSLMRKMGKLQAENFNLMSQNKELKTQIKKLDKMINDALSKDPVRIYDRYPPRSNSKK